MIFVLKILHNIIITSLYYANRQICFVQKTKSTETEEITKIQANQPLYQNATIVANQDISPVIVKSH